MSTNDELAASVEQELVVMRAELRRAMASAERAERVALEVAAAVDTLTDILRARGQLGPGHLRLLARARQHLQLATAPRVHLDANPDKYLVESTPIDCASRIHLCHGRCCAYSIALSEQDLREGELEWRIDEPYYLPHGPDGYCAYQDRSDGGCRAYQHRPAQCRQYDCREDASIWIDFEAGVPAPLRPGLVPIRLPARRPT
jgi:Fe-S-cluster containining protein